MNREVNNGVALNPQTDMLPLLTLLQEELERDQYFLRLLQKKPDAVRKTFWTMKSASTTWIPASAPAFTVNFSVRPVWTT